MIYFVRHGQSQANVDNVFAGLHYFAPLTAKGREQAERGGRRILRERLRIDHIITSPIERAHDTAKIIAQSIGIDSNDIQIDPRLAEYNMGELSGKSMKGVTPAQKISAPDAEDPQDFQDRVQKALDSARMLPGNTLIVSHAGVGRMIEAIKQELEPARFYELKGYPNAQVVSLDAA